MANNSPVLTGALAIVIVNNKPVGLMKNIRAAENTSRAQVRGLGSILPKEAPVTAWSGTVSCSFYEIDFKKSGVPGATRRDVGAGNGASQVTIGNNVPSYEDQLVLDTEGVQLNIFKKIKDVLDPATGLIIPGKVPYAIITRVLIESDSINIDEGSVAGRDQSFQFLDPITYSK
jgi:hypothetical protein